MNLRGKKFVLIGGAGLIGSHTAEELIKEDIKELVIFDNFFRGSMENIKDLLKDDRVKIFEAGGDITQIDLLNSALKNTDGVFHFAALWLLQCHMYPRAAFKVNVEGMFNVLEACVKNNIKRLVWSSSASVYGDAEKEPMTEKHPFKNKNFYGSTKIAGEAMATAFSNRYNLKQVGLRYMNVYGPRQDYHGAYIAVMMKMLDAIENNKSPKIMGDGTEAFDFVYVKDCAVANICAMIAETSDEYYNVGTGIKTTLKELAEKLLKLLNSNLKIEYEDRSEATLVKSRVGCTVKAEKEIKFTAKTSLHDGLKDLIKWRKIDKQKRNEKKKY